MREDDVFASVSSGMIEVSRQYNIRYYMDVTCEVDIEMWQMTAGCG